MPKLYHGIVWKRGKKKQRESRKGHSLWLGAWFMKEDESIKSRMESVAVDCSREENAGPVRMAQRTLLVLVRSWRPLRLDLRCLNRLVWKRTNFLYSPLHTLPKKLFYVTEFRFKVTSTHLLHTMYEFINSTPIHVNLLFEFEWFWFKLTWHNASKRFQLSFFSFFFSVNWEAWKYCAVSYLRIVSWYF